MIADPGNPDQIQLVAQIVYGWSFGAHNGGLDWDREVERSLSGSGYSRVIVERCFGTARAVLAALAGETDPTLG